MVDPAPDLFLWESDDAMTWNENATTGHFLHVLYIMQGYCEHSSFFELDDSQEGFIFA